MGGESEKTLRSQRIPLLHTGWNYNLTGEEKSNKTLSRLIGGEYVTELRNHNFSTNVIETVTEVDEKHPALVSMRGRHQLKISMNDGFATVSDTNS